MDTGTTHAGRQGWRGWRDGRWVDETGMQFLLLMLVDKNTAHTYIHLTALLDRRLLYQQW